MLAPTIEICHASYCIVSYLEVPQKLILATACEGPPCGQHLWWSLPIWKPLGLLQFIGAFLWMLLICLLLSSPVPTPRPSKRSRRHILLFSYHLSGLSLLFFLSSLPFGQNSLRKVGSISHSPEENLQLFLLLTP